MPALTIATFNCQNLFRRFKFDSALSTEQIDKAIQNGFIVNSKVFEKVEEPERILTAKMIKDTKADIVALQEVENLDTLKNFCTEFNLAKTYPYKLLIDGNDPRFIDVAVLSKFPFDRIATHQYVKDAKKKPIFSRDCLELEFIIEGQSFMLFINHLKSMFDMTSPKDGRANTAAKRRVQVQALLKIITERLGNTLDTAAFAVVGDFNDYPSLDTSLKELFETSWLTNVVERLPANEQWTHFWDNNKLLEAERYRQLDYIWLSKLLATNNPTTLPVINRRGLSKKAKHAAIPKRYPEIEEGKQNMYASDHCSVSIKVQF